MTDIEEQEITCRIAGVEDIPLLADFRWRLKTDDTGDSEPTEESVFTAECIRSLERAQDDAS